MKLLIVGLIAIFATSLLFAVEQAPALPDDPSKWLDGKALRWQDLQGKVVLVNVWTFACWNSYRSLPWIVSLQKKFPDLRIIGIHSPEFDSEKDRNRLRQTMAQYKVTYPQVLDDDHDYWDQLNNRYWPAFYLVDKHGVIRGRFAGETHPEDSQAEKIEALIQMLSMER